MSQQSPRHIVSRRSVAKGAAWTLPVVAFAASAPAASASTATTCSVTITGNGVKQNDQGDKTVTFSFTVVNNGSTAQAVTLVSIVGPANATWSGITPTSWQAAPGTSTQDVLVTRGNNANGDATITFHVCDGDQTVTAYVSL
ncbi:hypothetical protein [Flexivirga sp. B27]